MLNNIKHIIITTLSILFLSILLSPAKTFAATNFFVDPSIINKTFTNWNSSTIYNENDLVMFNDKVYSATKTISGHVPGTDSNWLCKADLTFFNMINESDECSLIANTIDSKLRYQMEIEVLRYKGSITQNTYNFTVVPHELGLFAPWTASVWSFISYDDGEHMINPIDTFSSKTLSVNVPQSKQYYYHHISEVKAVITGTYCGKQLEPVGCFMKN